MEIMSIFYFYTIAKLLSSIFTVGIELSLLLLLFCSTGMTVEERKSLQ